MPRLLRVHFASIGHKDARLAPLTLDFRHATDGTGADSVIWLRNGGGKSSIINLFYSLFLPNRRDFLGSAAEGKSRRIEDYIKAEDLAAVVTQWDVAPPGGPSLFPQRPVHTRVVGQILSWKGLRVSKETRNLRRLFFSLKTRADVYTLDDLPLQGLGPTAPNFEAVRDALQSLASEHPELEVTLVDGNRKWQGHLQSLGIDTELFRYQLHMNRREGAADEAFRFASPKAFVDFLLDVAFDPKQADAIASNFVAQRLKLEQRPRYVREQAFIHDSLQLLTPFVAAVDRKAETLLALQQSLGKIGSFYAGLIALASDFKQQLSTYESSQLELKKLAQLRRNERDKHNRWARGLTNLGLRLDLEASQQRLEEAKELLQACIDELKLIRAALDQRQVNELQHAISELEKALQDHERELAPLLVDTKNAGSQLVSALTLASARVEEAKKRAETRRNQARAKESAAEAQQHTLNREIGQLEAKIDNHKQFEAARTKAREKLLSRGFIEHLESADEAISRWQRARERAETLTHNAEEACATIRTELEQHAANKVQLTGLQAGLTAEHKELETRIERATVWRDELASDPLLQEIEGDVEVNLETPGLTDRIRRQATQTLANIFDVRVDSAEDQRALQAIDDTGLLPPPRDTAEVVTRLKDLGIQAFEGTGYLAEHYPRDCGEFLQADPARYAGVIVQQPRDLDRVRALNFESLRAPVQVSLPATNRPPLTDDRHTLLPHPATYQQGAALTLRDSLSGRSKLHEERQAELENRHQKFMAVADNVARFIGEHGHGKLDRMVEHSASILAQIHQATGELDQLETACQTLHEQHNEAFELQKREQATASQASKARDKVAEFIDRFERDIESRRSQNDTDKQTRHRSKELLEQAVGHKQTARARVDEANQEIHQNSEEHRRLVLEAEGVQHRNPDVRDDPPDLEQARQTYQIRLDSYERRRGASALQGRIDEKTGQLKKVQAKAVSSRQGLDHSAVEATAQRPDLERQREELDQLRGEKRTHLGRAQSEVNQAKAALKQVPKRREADDLPPDCPQFDTGEEARAEAERHRNDVERLNRTVSELEGKLERSVEQAKKLTQNIADTQELAKLLKSVVEASDSELPSRVASEVAATREERHSYAEHLKKSLRVANRAHKTAIEQATTLAQKIRQLATSPRHEHLKLKARDRMREPDEQLMPAAESLTAGLRERAVVLEQTLRELDRDRTMLVKQLTGLGDDADGLFRLASRASLLPSDLQGWENREYLRFRYQFPPTSEERRSRLEPLVDRLIGQAEIPAGIDLVKLAVKELAGPRSFEIKILKPDTILRPETIPIEEMASFSRGQQLTAAILLYCTLVQLRARSHGRNKHGMQDAGVLILDNPIGTCSNATLLELQRRIASKLRVQLVYATGVEDVEALATLPNIIRLCNAHRDRRTKNLHVTQVDAANAPGVINGVRIVERPAR